MAVSDTSQRAGNKRIVGGGGLCVYVALTWTSHNHIKATRSPAGRPEEQMTFATAGQKVTWFSCNFQKDGMSSKKVLPLVLMLLLSQLACDAHSVSECCSLPSPRSCRLYMLLCRYGGQAAVGPRGSDVAAGILTLGKRGELEEEQRLQSRLQQLLHGSRNQAAGILTMGKRTAEQRLAWRRRSDASGTTPLPAFS
ncbi:hypocretin neuropeptide precursor [Nelusetta ayraudi]|uniref:hypocretin neuropeptide precursor n=1 Tax=Nelusetta ayraudi TaxID=303726 RepID=UPI003F71BA28